MAEPLKLEVLTPHRKVLSIETPWVNLPGSLGELGILPEHVPLVTTVDSGILRYEENGERKSAAVHYGYAQVSGRHVTVLTEMVELSVEIDRRRAENAEERAVETLRRRAEPQADEHARLNTIEAKLRRAIVRRQASE